MDKAIYYITRLQEDERVRVFSGKVSMKQDEIHRRGQKKSYYNDLSMHYWNDKDGKFYPLDEKPENKKVRRIVVFDFDNPSPLQFDFKQKKWVESNHARGDIDDIVQDTAMEQGIEVAAMNVFMLDPQMIKIVLIVVSLGLVIGIPLNSIFHFLPSTIVHWIP